jgi:anti-sigma28 factor (negative regulator of flagellin synthesis)
MLTKKKVISSIRELPEEFSAEEAIERIILLQKIENGIYQSDNNKVVSNAVAKKRVKKWLK